jgi:hypothetical protein
VGGDSTAGRAGNWQCVNRLCGRMECGAVAGIPGNSFTGPSHLAHMRGGPQLIACSAAAQDPGLARRLWTASEQLTNIRFPLPTSLRL